MRIKQREVPIRLRRIVAEHLESIRMSKMGKNTQDLYLGEEVCPIYRPDMEKPAYYEFQLLKATREKVDNRWSLVSGVGKINDTTLGGRKAIYYTREIEKDLKKYGIHKLRSNVQGFIIVSAGEHDFPIPHWSLETEAPSLLLESKAISQKKKLVKMYKVDSLAYLGEDENGKEIDHLGDIPPLLKGLPDDLAKFEGRISSSVSAEKRTKDHSQDDSTVSRSTRVVSRGAKPYDFTIEGGDWQTLKKQFKSSFKPMLEMLSNSAKEVWVMQKMIEEMGEGIIAGETFYLAPLEKKFAVTISGDASEFVKTRIVQRPDGNSVVGLTTTKLPFNQETDLVVEFNYGGGFTEKVNLFVVNRDTPTESINNDKTEEK